MRATALLSVRQLSIGVGAGGAAPRPVIEQLSFELAPGAVVALLGESGSGKSLAALGVAGLLPPGARRLGGEVLLEGRDLLALPPAELRRVRGRRLALIFEDPRAALSPAHAVGRQLATALEACGRLSRQRPWGLSAAARELARELLARVDLPDPEQLLDAHPHQLSEGMQRRLLVALALAGEPQVLIADQPTAGLDPTSRSQLLQLFEQLVRTENRAALLISHDLAAVRQLATEALVLYAGHVVEAGAATRLLESPRHPYTRQLLEAYARLGAGRLTHARRPPSGARSEPPPAEAGCRFAGRCPERLSRCGSEPPELSPAEAPHRARCFRVASSARGGP